MESFFRSLKAERVYLTRYGSYQEAKTDLFDYIRFYNHRRRHSTLGYLSPMELSGEKQAVALNYLSTSFGTDQADLPGRLGRQRTALLPLPRQGPARSGSGHRTGRPLVGRGSEKGRFRAEQGRPRPGTPG